MHFVEIQPHNQGPIRFNLDFIAHIDFVVYPESKAEPAILTIVVNGSRTWEFYQKTDRNTEMVDNEHWNLRLINNLDQVYSNLLKAIECVQTGCKFKEAINLGQEWKEELIIK